MKQYEELKVKKEELAQQLDSLKERDPETIGKLSRIQSNEFTAEESIKQAVDGANRWTGLVAFFR